MIRRERGLRGSGSKRIVKEGSEFLKIPSRLRKAGIHGRKAGIHGRKARVQIRTEVIDPLADLSDLQVAVEYTPDDGHQDRHENGHRLGPCHTNNIPRAPLHV